MQLDPDHLRQPPFSNKVYKSRASSLIVKPVVTTGYKVRASMHLKSFYLRCWEWSEKIYSNAPCLQRKLDIIESVTENWRYFRFSLWIFKAENVDAEECLFAQN